MKHSENEFMQHELRLPELTMRGMILGAILTIIFTASNVYLGLKVGLTFSSAIPAAVISMAVLKMAKDANTSRTTWCRRRHRQQVRCPPSSSSSRACS